MSSPRLARVLLRLLVWGPAHEAIAGDLEEELATEARPRHGVLRGRLWFWRQTVLSILAFYRLDLTSPRSPRQGEGTMLQDLGYGLRMLRKNLGFTTAAVVTLGLGIGANVAVFSVVHTFLIKPLPYDDPSRVAFVLGWNTQKDRMRFNLAFADFADLEAQSSAFDELAAYRYWSANLTGADLPERVQAYRTTVNTFELLGVEPLHGRAFAADEAEAGKGRVAVLSYGLWQRRFGGDPGVVGRDVTLDGERYAVVGVMPPRFEFPIFNYKGDLWVPLTDDPAAAVAERRRYGSVVVVGRLAAGVSLATAQAEVDALMGRLAADHPHLNSTSGARVVPMQEMLAEQVRPALLVLLAAVALVLLLACANVANLLLARGVARARELALRTALGAGTGRLVRQLLTESLLLALAGGALGVGLAYGGLRALRAALPDLVTSTMPGVGELGVDGPTLAFALGASLLTGLLFGLAPAMRAARTDLQGHLKEGAQGAGAGKGRQGLRRGLIVAEVALSLLLLVVTGLLVRSFRNLLAVDTGFDARGVLALSISLPPDRYPGAEGRRQFFERAARAAETVPGVEAAGWVNTLPFSTSNEGTRFAVGGRPEPAPGELPRADFRVAGPDYLETLRVAVLEGRGIAESDRAGGPRIALVNRALAELHFPGESPLGRRLRLGADAGDPWHEIVGVVGNVRHWELARDVEPEIYVPLAQMTPAGMTLAVRSARAPEDLAALVRSEILKIDPMQPIFHVKTLEAMVAESYLPRTLALVMMTVFAVLALVLAALGLYGVIAYAVSQSTREIGIRMALGARSVSVLGRVVREGMTLVAVGALLGWVGAWGLTRFLSSLLFGITPRDPAAFVIALPVLALVALIACLLPAWRAARVDPVVALRVE